MIGKIYYGQELRILGNPIDSTSVALPLQGSTASDTLMVPAGWMRITYKGRAAYLLSTYLSPLPPPKQSREIPLGFAAYLLQLSPVLSENVEAKTTEFCSRLSRKHANGIRYVSTDFGPCESCGHAQEKIYFPGITPAQAWMMATHLYRLLRTDNPENYLHYIASDNRLELYMESGQSQSITIHLHDKGLWLTQETYL